MQNPTIPSKEKLSVDMLQQYLDVRDEFEKTPLHRACRIKNVPWIEVLLEFGAGRNNGVKYESRNAVDTLCQCWEVDLYDHLQALVRSGAELNTLSEPDLFSPLHRLCGKDLSSIDLRAMKLPLENGANPRARVGREPLHIVRVP
jgi:ankyrin repeat protein